MAVEAGDFAQSTEQFGAWEVTEFAARMSGKLKYDAWTPGERELFFGKDAMNTLVAAMGAEVVSANITDKSGKLMFKDRLIKTVGSVKVGITGVTAGTLFETVTTSTNAGKGVFEFKDIFESLKPVVADLKTQTNTVIVLAHVGPGDARRLAEEVPGVDVVVVGHNPGYLFNPDRVGETLIVRGGTRGQYAARLTLSYDAKKTITDYKGQADPLGDGVTADAAMGAEIGKFQEEQTRLQAKSQREKALQSSNDKGGEKFLGDEICARCHSDIYTTWSRTPHASAFQTLLNAGKEKDKACLPCHVVGLGDPSGYQTLVYADRADGKVDTTDSVNLRNVQCESCHGKGTQHGQTLYTTKLSRETCLTCHDATNDKDFNFDKAMAAGVHGK